ncbi:MAG: hypothetical protein E7374_03675 [Clostridiales bacterium]|nr:hypothetical protein [Clostridiales bacterium]
MRTKKSVKITRFDENFKTSYNFKVGRNLSVDFGIHTAEFPNDDDDPTEYPLNVEELGLSSIDMISVFKQYYAEQGTTLYRFLLYGSDKKMYVNEMFDQDFNLYDLYDLTFEDKPIVLTYKNGDTDAIIMSSKNDMKIWKSGYSPYTIPDVPIVTSMCMNDGVLFCTIQNPIYKIWYATDLNFENIGQINENSGYISLNDDLGHPRKVLSFDDSVYVFRDYGISKITFIKGQISVTPVYTSNTKLFSNTVTSCGNIILFMTKDGIFSFNGVKVSQVKTNLPYDFSTLNAGAVASSLGDKYYLALKIDFLDGRRIGSEFCDNYVNNAIIILDLSDLSYQLIRGYDIKEFCPFKTELKECMLTLFNTQRETEIGEITKLGDNHFDSRVPRTWETYDLVDRSTNKEFVQLVYTGTKGVYININYDGETKQVFVSHDGTSKFNFKIRARTVDVQLFSDRVDSEIEELSLDYYEY